MLVLYTEHCSFKCDHARPAIGLWLPPCHCAIFATHQMLFCQMLFATRCWLITARILLSAFGHHSILSTPGSPIKTGLFFIPEASQELDFVPAAGCSSMTSHGALEKMLSACHFVLFLNPQIAITVVEEGGQLVATSTF
jgi:hypothetical protein